MQKQIGQTSNAIINSKKPGNLKDSAHSNFLNNTNKEKNPKITFLEKEENNQNKNLNNDEDKGIY